jgi:hypothetical protein
VDPLERKIQFSVSETRKVSRPGSKHRKGKASVG